MRFRTCAKRPTRMWSRWRRASGLTRRIGPKFLRPGIGYGGSCFPKDVAAFRSVAEQMGVDFSLLTEVEKINVAAEEALPEQGAVRSVDAARASGWRCWGSRSRVRRMISGSRRRSTWCQMFLGEGCWIVAFDPAAMERAKAKSCRLRRRCATRADSSYGRKLPMRMRC